MNRRQFIKGTGLGIAGILAAGYAPAQQRFYRYTPRGLGSIALWAPHPGYATNDGSNRASSVPDLSGAGRTLTGGGTTKNPAIVTNAYHGYGAYRFTTAAQSQFSFSSLTVGTNWYAWCVCKTTGASVNLILFSNTVTNNRQIIVSAAEAGIKAFDGTNVPISNAVDVHSALCLIEMVSQAGTCSVWKNGASVPMALNPGLNSFAITDVGNIIGAAFCDQDLVEFGIATAVPNTITRQYNEEFYREMLALY